ncbi:unnamed protein product [Heterobilharzia americana]|nr:unnamed protein product [Heterobilharzia americana]
MRKSNISTETQMLSLHRVKAFSSPKRENIDQPSSIKNSTVKDSQNLQIDQHRSQCLRTGSPSKVKDSCTGPDSSSRNSVSSQLLKAVENAVRSSRDHHAIRRQHVSANVAHRNRYPRLLCRTNQVPVEVSGMRSGDCSSEPETQSREASCTLYAVRAHSKDLTDAGHRAVKDNEQLTCNQNSTLNALIPDSSNNIGDIHSLGDHSTQEVELASNEPVTNSFHHSGQSSTHFSPKNDSFYSVENKSADLDIPEVLGLTPPISHEQEFTEDRTDTPSIRKKLSQSEDTCNDVKDNESRAVCTECSTHSRCNSLSNHSEEESNHSQRFRKTAENQKEEGEIADDVDEDDYADVFNSSASHISQTRKRCWSRSSPVIHKTPKLCSERQTMDSATSQVSPDLKNAPPYPKRVQRRSSRSSQHYSEKDGSRNSSSGFVDLSYRASPGCEDRHSPNVVTTRFSHSPERRHRGSRYNSSISRSPSMKHSRGEYHNDPYRSSNSRSKNHPSRRRYKSPEINGRDFNLGKHDRSTISSNSPRRRFRHSPAPPNNPNSSYRRFERDRMTRDNRRFRAFSPALNRNPHHRLGINSSKVSGSRFNRVHHQRRF